MVLPSGLNEIIATDESLVRFLFSKQYTLTSVKASAFMPVNGTTSIARHGIEPLARLWSLGAIAAANRSSLKGAAFFDRSMVEDSDPELTVEAADPPAFHAHIIGWDTNEEPVEPNMKARQIEQALKLAMKCGVPFLKAENDLPEGDIEVALA